MSESLPDFPNLDWLRKRAKRQLDELRVAQPSARLTQAQLAVARQYGFSSWRALKAHIDSLTVDGQLFELAKSGDLPAISALLTKHPAKLYVRNQPYEWTLLHLAAQNGHLPIVDLLLRLGLDVNVKEKGDDTYAMHWAAAAGHGDVVRRLADAGGDVVGHGDDHGLEIIGWATCWDGCDDAAHRAIADFLVTRGARHHIFSAIAMNLADGVRRIVAEDPSALERQMTRFEDYRRPLHFAVQKNRPDMVALLIELGANPVATDGTGFPPVAYATAPATDRAIVETLRARGQLDLFTALALGDWDAASTLAGDATALAVGGPNSGVLHLMAKRDHVAAARWLLEHGADVNALWNHWDALVTPLHLAILDNHPQMAQLLLDAGANTRILDSKHHSDALGWAAFFERGDLVELVTGYRSRGQ